MAAIIAGYIEACDFNNESHGIGMINWCTTQNTLLYVLIPFTVSEAKTHA